MIAVNFDKRLYLFTIESHKKKFEAKIFPTFLRTKEWIQDLFWIAVVQTPCQFRFAYVGIIVYYFKILNLINVQLNSIVSLNIVAFAFTFCFFFLAILVYFCNK